jgi:hypothetical protein
MACGSGEIGDDRYAAGAFEDEKPIGLARSAGNADGVRESDPRKGVADGDAQRGQRRRHLQCRIGNAIGEPERLRAGTEGKDQNCEETERIPHIGLKWLQS